MDGIGDQGPPRTVHTRALRLADLPFLVWSGLDRERIGVQYPKGEWHRQFLIAPLRYLRRRTRTKSCLIEVDDRRAGFVGLNPLSENIEYYLLPWARGGTGRPAIAQYLRSHLPFTVDKHAFMLSGNDRSTQVFRGALHDVGLSEPTDYEYFEYPGGSGFRIIAGTAASS